MPNKTYLYYRLKPFIPFRVRIALRRWRAMRLRGQYRNSWPILEKAAALETSVEALDATSAEIRYLRKLAGA